MIVIKLCCSMITTRSFEPGVLGQGNVQARRPPRTGLKNAALSSCIVVDVVSGVSGA